MIPANDLPIIVLVFATGKTENHSALPELGREYHKLKGILKQAEKNNLCKVESIPYAQIDNITEILRDYQDRIAIFHYAGHAKGLDLLLSRSDGGLQPTDMQDFSEVFTLLKTVKLVFLNGCGTSQQIKTLLSKKIPAVIATTSNVRDVTAVKFATEFYKGLANGLSIDEAYRTTHSPLKSQLKEDFVTWTIEYHSTLGEDAKTWNLPSASRNFLFGLPEPNEHYALPESPHYEMLKTYGKEQAEIFWGRGEKIRELYFSIVKWELPIILLYGVSGVGKSSLLEAGLIPRLKAEGTLCVYYAARDPEKGLLGTLQHLLEINNPVTSIGEAWRSLEAKKDKHIVIILDQVEEAITRRHASLKTELEDFKSIVISIFSSNPPKGKLLLAFRKEYLAEIEIGLKSVDRIFLPALGTEEIIETITGPIVASDKIKRHYKLEIKPDDLPERIAHDLTSDPDSPLAPILNILLNKMWHSVPVENDNKRTYTLELYQQLARGGVGLSEFVQEQLKTFRPSESLASPKLPFWQADDYALALDILECHITSSGTAGVCTQKKLNDRYQHCQDKLTDIVEELKDLRLLSDEKPDKAPNNKTRLSHDISAPVIKKTRLSHDTLAPVIKEMFGKSEEKGQIARRTLEYRSKQNGQTYLNEYELGQVEAGRLGMREWEAKEAELVKQSKKSIEQSKSEQKRYQQKRRLFITAAMIIILILGVFSFKSWQQSQQESIQKLTNESVSDANKALGDLDQAPTDNLQIASKTLIEMPVSRPYVPLLEFAVTQSIQHTLERKRVDVQVSSNKKLALGKAYIAVGKSNGVEFMPLPLALPAWITEPISDSSKVQRTELYSVPIQLSDNAILAIAPNDDLFVYDGGSTISTWREQKIWKQQTVKSSGSIQCPVWKPDSSAIVFCLNRELWLWELKRDRLEKLYTTESAFFAADWSPDGKHLLLITDSNTPLLYSDELHKVIQLKGHIEYVAGGRFITKQRFMTWEKGVLFIWSTTGQLIAKIPTQKEVNGISISEEKNRFAIYHQEGSVDVWQVDADGSTLTQTISLLSTGSMITDAAWRDQYLATADSDGDLHLWDVQAGSLIATLHGHTPSKRINRVMWLSDKEHLLSFSQDQSVRVWRVFDGQQKPICQQDFKGKTLQCRTLAIASLTHPLLIENADWFKKDKVIFNDQVGALYQWSPEKNIADLIIPMQYENQTTRWSDDKTKALIYGQPADQAVNGHIWYEKQGNWIRGREISYPILDAKWNHNLLLIIDTQFKVHLVNTDTEQGESVLPITFHEEIPYPAFYNEYLALGTQGQVSIWQLGITKSDPVQTLRSTEQPTTSINPSWSTTGEYIVGRSLQNDTVTLWDSNNSLPLWQYQDKQQKQFDGPTPQITPNSKYVAFAIGSDLYVLDAVNGNLLKKETTLQKQIVGLSWNSNGTRLLTWVKDSTVLLWDWDGLTLTEILRLYLEGSPVQAILSRDESRLLTADNKGNLVIWKVWPNIQALVEDVKAISNN